MINPDSGGYRLLSVARLLEISFQRPQHLVRANYTFFWQLIPPLPDGAQKYTSLATTLKRAHDVLTSTGRRAKAHRLLNTPAQLLLASISRDVSGVDVRSYGLVDQSRPSEQPRLMSSPDFGC